MHVAGRCVAVLARVEQSSPTQNTRETADGAQTGRTTTHDNDIVVSLGDGGREGNGQEGKEGVEGGEHLASHDAGLEPGMGEKTDLGIEF